MSDIKSFREIAMEKIANMGDASEEEQLRWKYMPEGEKLAASCLKDGCDIKSKINSYDKKVRSFILKGAEKVFIANINIPKSDAIKNTNDKSIENILFIKKDKAAVKEVIKKLTYIFEHYNTQGKQQRDQSYELLKSDFQNKLEKALEKQGSSSKSLNINVESLPQFQDEWRKILSQIDNQYNTYLNEYKQLLKDIE